MLEHEFNHTQDMCFNPRSISIDFILFHEVFVNETFVGGYFELKATRASGQFARELIHGN